MVAKTTLEKGLPKMTHSVCPECKKILGARLYEENGKVMIGKECPLHGKFKDVYWSDVNLYLKAERWAKDGKGVSNPNDCGLDNCGLYNLHLSHLNLGNIDLTNRCNLCCPICFANAGVTGFIYEPSLSQIHLMLENLRKIKPVPCPAVQFSGGEPTIYPKFIDVIKDAKGLKFAQIQVATNGIRFAKEFNFLKQCVEAGLNTIYLQFDGTNDEIYQKVRGRPMMEIKEKVIENVKKIQPEKKRPTVVLVPTVVMGLNDCQVGEILKYGIYHREVIKAVNFQPVSFSGRISQREIEKQRYTLPDLVIDLEKQTGFLNRNDFYPIPIVAPISELVSILFNRSQVAFTPHHHCGLATYLFFEDNGRVVPITRFIDIEGLFGEIEKLCDSFGSPTKRVQLRLSKLVLGGNKKKLMLRYYERHFSQYINEEKAPNNLDIRALLSGVLSTEHKSALTQFSMEAMMVGAMHFQDDYNYDIERVKRCVIHYATPDGRIVPFCAYNGGPTIRNEIEKKYSRSKREK